jgi:hypothetical protein
MPSNSSPEPDCGQELVLSRPGLIPAAGEYRTQFASQIGITFSGHMSDIHI